MTSRPPSPTLETPGLPCRRPWPAHPAALVLVLALLAGGGCGDEPVAPVPTVSYDELVRGCVAATACRVKAYPRVADCVNAYYNLHRRFGLAPLYDQIYHCVLEADGDCDDVFTCFGAHRNAGACDSSFKAVCDESRALSCDLLDRRVFSYDCGAVGLSCSVKDSESFEALCAAGSCKSSFTTRCEEGRVLSCIDGVIEVDDCKARGLVCGKDKNGRLDCQGAGKESCDVTSAYKPKCQGTVAYRCVGNKVHSEDCAQRTFNRRCKDGVCVPSGSACSGDFDRCKDSGTLEFCLDGTWQAITCSKMGFGRCLADVNGASCREAL